MMYELLYIVPASFADTEVDGVKAKVAALLEKAGGAIVRHDTLGKIRLAYPIKGQRHGTYVLAYLTAEGTAVAGMERSLRLADEVLRHHILIATKGAETTKFEITSYVAPLSEEARETKEGTGPRREGEASRDMRPKVAAAPRAAAAAVVAKVEPAMSVEELDRKLDAILEGDVTASI